MQIPELNLHIGWPCTIDGIKVTNPMACNLNLFHPFVLVGVDTENKKATILIPGTKIILEIDAHLVVFLD